MEPVQFDNFPKAGTEEQGYRLEKLIGKGATGMVWKAVELSTNTAVAIKIMNLDSFDSFESIRKEIHFMMSCSEEEYLVKYHTSVVQDQFLWLVMEYLDGGSLLEVMRSAYPKGLEEDAIVCILAAVLKALEYLHKDGRLHRDVKAANILVDRSGAIRLADFGVSAWLVEKGERKEVRQTFVGTPCWMAPEVMEQSYGYNTSADIWSVGITALELCHGRAPNSNLKPMKILMEVLTKDPPTLAESEIGKGKGKFSKDLKKFIDSCLQKDPSKRPTATKLLESKIFKKSKPGSAILPALLAQLTPIDESYGKHKAAAIKKAGEAGGKAGFVIPAGGVLTKGGVVKKSDRKRSKSASKKRHKEGSEITPQPASGPAVSVTPSDPQATARAATGDDTSETGLASPKTKPPPSSEAGTDRPRRQHKRNLSGWNFDEESGESDK